MTGRKRAWYFTEGEDEPHGGWQYISDVDDPTFDAVAARMEESPDPPVDLWRGLGNLTAKQRFVIDLRYGLDAKGEHSLEEIALAMGISHQAVSAIEKRALIQLNRATVEKAV